MAAPTITSVTPSDGETNVFMNKKFIVVFSEAIDPDSVNGNTVRLVQSATEARVWTELELSQDGLTLTITPQRTLGQDETYRLRVLGDDTGLSFYILSLSTSDPMAATTTVEFTTGDDIEAWSSEKTDTTIQREGELSLPADIQVVSGQRLTILETTPTNHSSGLPLSLSQVTAKFNAALDTGEFDSSWMSVTIRALMSYDEYLAKDRGDGTVVFSINDPEYPTGTDVDFTLPSGTVTMSGQYLIWTRDPEDDFLYNCEVEVIFSADVVDIYGNSLLEQHRFVFTLLAYPFYSGVDAVERELPNLPEMVDRDLIHALVWRNSIKAWQISGRAEPAAKAYRHYRTYAHAATCLDILDQAELPKTILAGQKKSLGDFFVGFEAGAVGKEGLKYKRLKAELEDAQEALRYVQGVHAVVKGSSSTDRPNWKHRTWAQTSQYNTSSRPGTPVTESGLLGNTSVSRTSELPGTDDSWD